MRKILVLLIALLLMLAACGQETATEVEQKQTEPMAVTEEPTEPESTISPEGYFVEEIIKDDGTKIIRHRLGNIKGKVIWSRTEKPDGTFEEKKMDDNNKTILELYSETDGTVHEKHYYSEGALKKEIILFPDGSSAETHYDYGESNGVTWHLGPVVYTKTVSTDGQVTEEGMPLAEVYYEPDGSWWEIIKTLDQTEDKIHFSKDGRRIERTFTSSERYLHEEFYENGLYKTCIMIDSDGTEIEEQYSEQGYYTYYRRKDQYGEREYFAGENNELVKYIENGTIYEGDEIPEFVISTFEELQNKAVESARSTLSGS